MELAVCCTCPDTPSLPLAPRPTGQFTDPPLPTLDFQSGLILERKSVQQNVVPLPSERCTTTMSALGSLTPGFGLVSSGSFHLLMVPRKIPARALAVKFSPVLTPGILYVGTAAPATVGNISTPKWCLFS